MSTFFGHYSILAGYLLRGASSVSVICLNYGIIILISIIIGLWKYIVITYFKHTTRTVLIITHYTRKGCAIIPKPNCQAVNSRCRRFDFSPSPFRHFGSIYDSIATTDLYKSVVATMTAVVAIQDVAVRRVADHQR